MIARDDAAAAALLGFKFARPFYPPFAGFLLGNGRHATGACVLNGFDGTSVNLTVAYRGRLAVADAREIARLCFIGPDCVRVLARTRAVNSRARRGLEALGFKVEGLLRKFFRDEDGILYGQLRSEQHLIRI